MTTTATAPANAPVCPMPGEDAAGLAARLEAVGATPVALWGIGQDASAAHRRLPAPLRELIGAVVDVGGDAGVGAGLDVEAILRSGARGVIITGEAPLARRLWATRGELRRAGVDIRIERNFLESAHWDQWLVDHEDMRRAGARGVRLGFQAPWPAPDHDADPRLLDPVLEHLPSGADLLEIGPGSGTYTAAPLERARSLTAVDISERLLFEVLERRFADRLDRLRLAQDRAALLDDVADESIDGAYSIDCFVHIKIDVVHRYMTSLHRTLRPGGVALLHCKTWNNAEIERWEGTERSERVYRTTHFAHPEMIRAGADRIGFSMDVVDVYASSWCALLRKG